MFLSLHARYQLLEEPDPRVFLALHARYQLLEEPDPSVFLSLHARYQLLLEQREQFVSYGRYVDDGLVFNVPPAPVEHNAL